jgi:beta-mannosidase
MLLQSLSGKWQFRNLAGADWYSGQVPGSVHLDLLSLDKIPDPFVADNELRVHWVAETDWEYRLEFTPDPDLLAQERQFLVFEGLDTLAEVTLNGKTIGQAENMFRRYKWEVTGELTPGLSSLSVTFRSPVAYTAGRQADFPLAGVQQALPGASYLRKAPCQFGWDWGPQLPVIGVWKEVRLEAYSTARLEDVHLRQLHRDGTVKLVARVSVEKWAQAEITAGEITAHLHATAPNGEVFETGVEISDDSAGLELEILNPELWYPNGYGPQPLYQVEVSLLHDGEILDLREFQVGLRTIELSQEPDEWGESFTFVVNGRPIFAKGANWIPADSFPTRISEPQLDSLLSAAAASHQNMLRVWGGGYYEDEKFYDLCDRYGLLVWQDFIFSCSVYPLDDPAFVENVRVEAAQNIGRLRHRACLALWCGNNEMEEGWMYWGWNVPQYAGLKEAYEKFFFHTLPAWVEAEDPDTPYWPSSPSSGKPFQGAHEPDKGDLHYWEVWHGRKPFSAYRKVYPRFMSEFGFQALPTFEMIAEFAPPEEWNMTSYLMDHHQRSPSGNGLIIAQMAEQFRMPKDFASLVYLSQTLQAEGIRYGVEHWRRNKPRVAGALYWQLNDCWPAVSWSSLDYSGRWKALHYAARRFFAPLLLSLVDDGPDIQIHLTSDLGQAWEGLLRWSVASLDGETLSVEERRVSLEPDETRLVERLHLEPPQERVRELILVAEIYEGERRRTMQIATLVPSKHLKLSDPGLETALSLEDGLLQIEITAGSLARFVEVGLEGAQVVFSDNYFDLPAGYTVTISAPLPPGWDLEQARDKLRLRSLYDTYRAD